MAGEFTLAGRLGYSSGVSWQRANIQAAATYLRERITAGAIDAKTTAIYEGLLEVLDPRRRDARLQRERLSAPQRATRVRRTSGDRRRGERRQVNLGSPMGAERRGRRDRRTGSDRRSD
jgi:hypothetical protein